MDTLDFQHEVDKFDKRVHRAILEQGHSQGGDGPFIVDGILSLSYTCDDCDRDVRTLMDFTTDKVTQEGDADTTPCG
jgi:hypothetical protein